MGEQNWDQQAELKWLVEDKLAQYKVHDPNPNLKNEPESKAQHTITASVQQ